MGERQDWTRLARCGIAAGAILMAMSGRLPAKADPSPTAQTPAAANQAPAAAASSGITAPLKVTSDGKFCVDVLIDGKGPFSLLIDSGSELMTIKPEVAKECGLTVKTGTVQVEGPTGGYVGVGQADVGTVKVAGLTLNRPVCSVESLNFPCDGLIGAPLFNAGVIRLDLAADTLTTYPPDSYKPDPGDPGLPIAFGSHRVPVVSGAIGGIDARFEIDTGSSFPVELLPDFVKTHDLADRFAKIGSVGSNSVSGPVISNVYDLSELDLGGKAIGGPSAPIPAVFLTSTETGIASDFDGRIGCPLLAGSVLTFDYAHEKLYFQPRPGLTTADSQPQ